MALQKIREGGHNPDTQPFEKIRGAATPMELWIELFGVFREWHREPIDTAAIGKIYEYAKWCLKGAPRGSGDAGTDPSTAAWVCFYEHIAAEDNRLTRRLVGEFMTLDEVRDVKDAFTYHLGEEGFARFLNEIRELNERKPKPNIPPHRRNPPAE